MNIRINREVLEEVIYQLELVEDNDDNEQDMRREARAALSVLNQSPVMCQKQVKSIEVADTWKDVFVQALSDADPDNGDNPARSYVSAWRAAMIDAGEYVAMTQAELDNTIVSGGKKYAFKLDGVCYRFNTLADRKG